MSQPPRNRAERRKLGHRGPYTPPPPPPLRVVYGAGCTWWDTIDKAAKDKPVPTCPRCGGVLYEVDSEQEWWNGVDDHERQEPGYRDLIEWMRGKCHPDFDTARARFALHERGDHGQL